ncbi:hypothetical protein [Streptomyces sp. NPDC093970]|uniref:hypothetical protein n=1 Tax=Streptomyces sp. NPDC093970 TaxID=3155076 RepID=UPI00341E5C5A
MARVVVVHGIGQQYEGARSLHLPIAPALCDGIDHAGGAVPADDDIHVAFYGNLFHTDGTRGGEEPARTGEDDSVESELALTWWRAAARIDPDNVQSPDDVTDARGRTPLTVKAALRALSMSRFATRATQHALLGELRQVRHYLYGDARKAVLEKVCAEITSDTEVVVGHSLGSVVAYEALCALPGHGVHALITLGSPLGIRHLVFDQLQPAPIRGKGVWPGAGVRWTNICDRHDVVALEEHLSGLFGAADASVTDIPPSPLPEEEADVIHDQTVDNGWRAHDLLRYLRAPATGRAIYEGLTA